MSADLFILEELFNDSDAIIAMGGMATAFLVLMGLSIASTIMTAIGLWKSARQHQGIWFILLFFFGQTFIIPLIYLLRYGNEPDPLPNQNQA